MAKEKKDIPTLDDLPSPSIMDVLTAEQREFLRAHYTVRQFRKNEYIYKEGDVPGSLMCLFSGRVKIFREGVGGRSQIVRIIASVGYFGYRALLADELFVTSAVAIEPCTVIFVQEEAFLPLLRQNNDLAMFFLKALAVDLGVSDFRTVNLAQKHIRGRLAESLLFLRDTYGLEDDGVTISVYLSREDLAGLSNMTTSNVIRTLAVFVSENILIVDGRKIKIIEEEKLKRISKFG